MFIYVLVFFAFILNSCTQSQTPKSEDLQGSMSPTTQFLALGEVIYSQDSVQYYYFSAKKHPFVKYDPRSQHPIVVANQFHLELSLNEGQESTHLLEPYIQNHQIELISTREQWALVQIPMNRDQPEQAIQQMLELAKILGSDPQVRSVSPNPIGFTTAQSVNDPQRAQLWGLDYIEAPQTWDKTTCSDQVMVWIVDTGIDLDHEDLKENLWHNPVEVSGIPGVDDDNNGFIDDTVGWDFVNLDASPQDDHNHGSHVAGTVGAQANNQMGIAGVCWGVRLGAIKVIDSDNSYYYSDLIEGIYYIIGMKQYSIIANMSLGGQSETVPLRAAFLSLDEAGVLTSVAAMNEGWDLEGSFDFYPVEFEFDNIIGVANIRSTGELNSGSNYGATHVDLAAPGTNILSTVNQGGYNYMTGTSMAAPHVSAVAAMLKSVNPEMTSNQIKARLLATVLPNVELGSKVATEGVLNANCAVHNIQPCELGQIVDLATPNIYTPLKVHWREAIIQVEAHGSWKGVLYNILGQEIEKYQGQGQQQISLRGLESGQYLFRVQTITQERTLEIKIP